MKLNYLSKKTTINKKDDYKLEFSDFEIVCPNFEFSSEKYICVSYAWENISTQHPFNNTIKISNRTLLVLQTACYSYQQLLDKNEKDILVTNKIWIDSLCIPLNNNDKDLHYFLMGEIYAKSMAVIVVLSKDIEIVLNKIRNKLHFTENDFEVLNQDKWVSRHWTYQEIVNSGRIYITSENSRENPVFASDFFDIIANEIENYTKINKLSTLDFQEKLPYLTSLEAVILDWKIMEYQERSVYQVMVNMEYRKSDFASSKLKAMFGCISNQLKNMNFNINDDYSTFLELCKFKGDFSLIFNTSMHRSIENQKWCPISYDFKPIFSWLYCFGSGQKGKCVDKYLELDEIILQRPNKPSEGTLKQLNNIMSYNANALTSDLLQTINIYLKKLSFVGSYNPIELEGGYYFNQFEIELSDEYIIGVSTGIQWTFGAPAMLLKKNPETGVYDFLSSGVFFGIIRNSGFSLHTIKIN